MASRAPQNISKTRDAIDSFLIGLTARLPLQKKMASIINEVAMSLIKRGAVEEAVALLSVVIKLDPDQSVYWSNLGHALVKNGRFEKACEFFKKGAKKKSAPASLLTGWGKALAHLNRFHDALETHKKAVARDPESAVAVGSLGDTYREIGRIDDALMNLDHAAKLNPGNIAITSSRLLTMNYSESLSNEDIAQAHFSWPGAMMEAKPVFENVPDPERVIKIGYVSADFRSHSCASFFTALAEKP